MRSVAKYTNHLPLHPDIFNMKEYMTTIWKICYNMRVPYGFTNGEMFGGGGFFFDQIFGN